MNKEIYLKK